MFLSMRHQVAKSFEDENDRVKLVVLFCGEDDETLVRAAAGCLAILSPERVICHKITTVSLSYHIWPVTLNLLNRFGSD